jgi:hypothetical protein
MKTTIELVREAGIDAWWDSGPAVDWREEFDEHLKAFEALVRADEREALAALFSQPDMEYFGREIQDAIRARGNT